MHAAAYKALPRLWFGFTSLEAGLLWFCKWGSRGSPRSELWSSCFLTTQSAWKHWWFRWTGGREKILVEIFVSLNLVQKAYCCVFLISIYSEVGLVLLKANLFSGHFVKNYIFHESFQLFFFFSCLSGWHGRICKSQCLQFKILQSFSWLTWDPRSLSQDLGREKWNLDFLPLVKQIFLQTKENKF